MNAPVVTLKACPFCGGEATINERLRDGYRFAECESCAFGLCAERTKAEAIAAWNTRTAAEASSAGMVRELVEALEWYAQDRNWRSAGMYMCGHAPDSACAVDRGERARQALARAHTTSEGEG